MENAILWCLISKLCRMEKVHNKMKDKGLGKYREKLKPK